VDEPNGDELFQATPAEHGAVIVRAGTSRLRLDEAQQLSKLIDEDHPDATAIILNLHGVDYIDSTGISLLVRVASMRPLLLCRLSAMVSDVLDSTGMLKLLNVDASERQAMDRFIAGDAAGPV
jgi:anti-anti-sigma factor